MGKILFTGILSALGLFFLTGCQNQLGYETEIRRITIKTEPQNAKVYQVNPVDKHLIYLGMSPVEAQPVNVITKFSGTDNRQVYDYLTTQLFMVFVWKKKALCHTKGICPLRKKTFCFTESNWNHFK